MLLVLLALIGVNKQVRAQITPGDPGNFVIIWSNNPVFPVDIVIPTHPDETYNYAIYWEVEDGVFGSGSATDVTGDFTIPIGIAIAGTVRVEIAGEFPRIFLQKFWGESTPELYGMAMRLTSVEQWGNIAWTSMAGAFYGASNLQVNATDIPDLSRVASLEDMFNRALAFTGNSSMADWDVVNITNMRGTFFSTQFDQPIGEWDVSNVTDLSFMFNSTNFNQDIGGWDVSNVTNMSHMFTLNSTFNQDIGDWKVGKVTDMQSMFRVATAFNQDLSRWDVSNVTSMLQMFLLAESFDQDLSNWDISEVTTMSSMLHNSGLSRENYDATLIGWATQENVPSDITLGAENLTFCDGAEARQQLIDEHGWTITGDAPACESMLIFVETEDGNTLIILAEGSDAIQQVKQKIRDKAGIHPDQQQLFFAGDELEDGRTLDDYGIENGNTLNLILNTGSVVIPGDPANFVTTWKTDNDGPSNDNQIRVPAIGDFNYLWANVDNPGEIGSGSGSGETTITFPQAGTYELSIAPMGSNPFNDIFFGAFVSGDKLKLLEIKNWGTIHWSGFAFGGCANLMVTATDIPDLTGVTDLSFAFSYSGIDEIPNINDWDVSNVTNMGNLFERVTDFNQPLDNWDVSNVTNMSFMFDGATSFNQPLDSWDVSKVEDISYMFRDATSFDQSLGAWELANLGGAIATFFRSGTSCENFSYTLYGWAINPNTNEEVVFGPHGIPYSPDVATYRDFLINNLNWNFQGSDPVGTCNITLPSPPITPDDNNILYVNINVDTDATGYTGVGDSWDNAVPELADALRWAREQHDGGSRGWDGSNPLRIFVAKGEYKPLYSAADDAYTTDGGRDNSFVLVPDVQWYGGFDPAAGIETLEDTRILPNHQENAAAGTVLNGDLNGNDAADIPVADLLDHVTRQDNVYSVVRADGAVGNALMDGFTVMGGNNNPDNNGNGGGISVHESSPTLSNLTVSRNSASNAGGGVASMIGSSPKLDRIVFSGNSAKQGGGMAIEQGSPVVHNSIFVGNEVEQVGGGLGVWSASPVLSNVTISDNSSSIEGGGMAIFESPATITNTVVWGNSAGSPDFVGVYVFVQHGSFPTFSNSLIENSGGSENWGDEFYNGIDGGGNIDVDPVFVSTAPGEAGYLQLSACSPAISVGSNQAYTDAGGDPANDRDMGDNPRVYNFTGDGVIDMGAYEYQGERLVVQSLTMPDAVPVAYGTALEGVAGIPTTVTATLNDDTDISIPLDGNLENWTLVSPAGSAYDGDVAGTYVFAVPLLIPETECYLNPENLEAAVTVVVAKGTLELTASWNGTAIGVVEGLSLTYGEVGELLLNTTDPDGVLTYAFGDDDAPVLDLAYLDAVAAQQAGTATLTIEQEETDNFEAASVAIAVTVAQKTIAIVPVAGQGKIYGADDPTAYGYDLADGDALAFDNELADIVSATSREEGEDVGVYDIELEFGGDQAANYAITFEADNNAFAITPLEITVAAADKTKVFGTNDPVLTYTFLPELIGEDALEGSLDREEGEAVGNYAITQGDLSLGNNYEITFEPGILTITPAGYEGVAFNDGSFVYDGTQHILELTGELPEDASVSYTIDGEAGNGATNAGTYEITAIIDGGTNYEDLELSAMLTITPLEITVTAADKTKIFGTDDPTLTYTFTPELIDDDVFTGALDREEGEDVGTYTIMQGDLSATDNYVISFVAGTLTIRSAAYEGVEFNNATHTYDGTEHRLTLTGELPEGASVRYENNGRTNVGNQTVTAIINGGNNYEDMTLTAELTVIPLEITVTAADKSKIFGANDPALTYTVEPGLIGDDAFTGGLNRQSGEEVGTYAITQGDLSAGDNYAVSFVAGTLTVLSRGLRTLDFPPLPEKTVGDADFEPGATASSGEEIIYTTSNPQVAEIVNGRIRITGAGEAIITATVPDNPSYGDRPSASQPLVVQRATQQITLEVPPEVHRDGGSIALEVSASSGLAVSLSIDNPEVAELDGTTLRILRLGTVQITATQDGDGNYEAAEPVTRVIRVVDPSGDLPVRVHPVVSPNGDGINEFLMIEAIQDYPENRVVIFNRNGTLLWEASGYDNNRIAFRGISTGQSPLAAGTYFYIVEVKDNGTWKHKKGYFVLRY